MGRNIRRLVVVSNRLPVAVHKTEDGQWKVEHGSGGLVTALSPVLRDRGGLWIGWAGCDGVPDLDKLLDQSEKETGYRLLPLELTQSEIDGYYAGFCNDVLWLLFHDFNSLCNFEPAYWPVYRQVNQKFAETIALNTSNDDYVWVHDYHLLLVAEKLREMGVRRRVGFFLHTPFPTIDVFIKLPWRGDILKAMLEYDLLGFQTMRDMRNFVQCIHMLIPGAKPADIRTLQDIRNFVYRVRALIPGIRSTEIPSVFTYRHQGHEVRVGAFPISIDFDDFVRRSSRDEITQEVKRIDALLPQTKLILGIDRLDYSKGIPLRIRAFGAALATYPELRGKVTLVQVVVPSRMDNERYQMLKMEIDRLVGDINGKYSEAGWTPVLYLFRSLAEHELLAYYRRCDIALVTPLKDGMNLVAKEYCACCLDNDGVLILSEFAGAAAQMRHEVLLVNPFDIEGVAAAIYRAFHLSEDERKGRMSRLRESIREHNIYRWVDNFLNVAIAKKMRDFPVVEDYLPNLHSQQPVETNLSGNVTVE